MKSSIRVAILGTVGLALVGVAGCENNEASVKGTGVTPPSAVTSSDAAGKIEAPPAQVPPGYGPAMGKRPPASVKVEKTEPKAEKK
jgi:hypothetical protein